MTTPFDQQPQPVPPSEGTNDAPEDRANAPTVPNTVPAGQPNVASDGATTTPMAPATASQRPAGAPFDRVYAVSPQQLFQVIHDQLTTGDVYKRQGLTGVAQGESVVDIPLLVRRPAGFHYFQRIVGDGVLIVSISAVSAAYSARAIGIVGS